MEKNNDTTYTVTSIVGRREMAEPGVYAYDAEAVVSKPDCADVYVHVNEYDMFKHYVVSEKSLMGADESDHEMTEAEKEAFSQEIARMIRDCEVDAEAVADAEYIEAYDSLAKSKGSEYYSVFTVLQKMVSLMAG